MVNGEIGIPRVGLVPLFLKFLRFGCLAFGGPVAQIAMIRQALVEDEHWIDGARFNRLLAVIQVLPGPEAHELCVHMGMMARGRIGGLLAGLGFMLPGFVLMLGCAWAYAQFVAGQAGLAGLLLGLQAAVLAIIIRAVWRIGKHVVTGRALALFTGTAAVATLGGVPFWILLILLILCGVAHTVNRKLAHAVPIVLIGALLGWWLAGRGDVSVIAGGPVINQSVGLAALFLAGLKGGLLTFGGAYTAIPYVRADTVGRGWIADGAFLDGVGIANALPAPLVIFATFTGFLVAGPGGAVAITVGMFLPAFMFSLVFFERLEAVVDNVALHRLLDGVAAAVVGIIAATWLQLAVDTAKRAPAPGPAILIFALALIAVIRWRNKLAPLVVLLLGAAAGWAMPGVAAG